MKYAVMGKVVEKEKKIKAYMKSLTYWKSVNDFCETGYTDVTDCSILDLLESFKTGIHDIYLYEDISFIKWKEIKSIDIQDGELRKNDKYEIDGKCYNFEICYNNNKDRMEIKLDYNVEVKTSETNKQVEEKYKVYEKLALDYLHKKREAKNNKVRCKEESISKKLPWYKRIFKRNK